MKPKIILALVFGVSSFIFVARSMFYAGFRAGAMERSHAQTKIVSPIISMAQRNKYKNDVVVVPVVDDYGDAELNIFSALKNAITQNRSSAIFAAQVKSNDQAICHNYSVVYNRWERTVEVIEIEMATSQSVYTNTHFLYADVTDAILKRATARRANSNSVFDELHKSGCNKTVLRDQQLPT